MKVPDGNKPIKVGDTSFIYHGVYHPISWLGNDPYRPRVEMLAIKDGTHVYLRLRDDIEKTPPDKRMHKYAIPGGSLDSDSSKLEQAIAETNEEALIKVSLVHHSGVTYYDLYEPGFLLKGGDMPIEYVGSVSDVYLGIYDGQYDKSKVEEKDLDDDMANNGKFYDIMEIARYLRKEHIQALLNCQFITDDRKAALRLARMDAINESADSSSPILVPGDKLYHGSIYEIDKFRPMSLDLGNAFQEPGWSTFCFADYEFAKMFAAARAFSKLVEDSNNGELDDDLTQIEFIAGNLLMRKSCFEFLRDKDLLNINVKFYVYTINPDGLDIGIGNDSTLKEYTFRDSDVSPEKIDTYQLSIMDLKEVIEVVDDDFGAAFNLNTLRYRVKQSEYSPLLTHDYYTETEVRDFLQKAISDGKLNPGDDIVKFLEDNRKDFHNDDVSIPTLSVGTEESVFESGVPVSTLEQKYSDSTYGLPERKAYPMPDEKHVRSAIRFFNYASAEEEKELAENINKKIRKFKIKDINVGEKNRFKKYYRPINEAFNLSTYADAAQQCLSIVNDESVNPIEAYKTYDTMRGLNRMLLEYLYGDNIQENITEDDKENIKQHTFSALAEISMNQVECMSKMESKDIRELQLNPIMEADDDDNNDDDDSPETATDYTKMADDQGAEDTDDDTADDTGNDTTDNPDDTPDKGDDTDTTDDSGDDTATDYTQMADDQGAEDTDDDTPDTDAGEDTGDDADTDDNTDDTGDDSDTGEEDESDTSDNPDDSTDEGDDSGDTDDTSDESTDDNSDTNNSEIDKRYNNKEIKNYFLLNSFLSMHETVVDVLDTVNGVVLPTPDANGIMAKVVKNLQSIKTFIEKFIQFQFSDSDYAFNLYYYNILMNALRMNLQLFETAVKVGGNSAENKDREKEE